MEKLSKLSFRTKLILGFVLCGLVPLMVSGGFWWNFVNGTVDEATETRDTVILQSRAEQINSYVGSIERAVRDLAVSSRTREAVDQFSRPFLTAKIDPSSEAAGRHREVMRKFYSETFAAEFKSKTGVDGPIEAYFEKLDDLALAAQYDFIAMNENPLGKKDLMVVPNRPSPYATVHAEYHPEFRKVLLNHSLYDIFIVDTSGRVVYTVFKEADFATSLASGPWSESGLGRAFKASQSISEGTVHFEDFDNYAPSYLAPASFASTPIFADGRRVGALIVQLPLDKITQAVAGRMGLGERGEMILIGSDGRLRADTHRNKETHTVASSFSTTKKLSIQSDAIKRALAGESGELHTASYDGEAVISSYMPIKFGNNTWAILAEVSQAEEWQHVRNQLLVQLGITIGLLLAIGFFAYWLGGKISLQVGGVAERLRVSSEQVAVASNSSASSATELSEAATEQAASLQETMASVEEISAMVSQNAESAVKAKNAVDANLVSANEGVQSVDEMLRSIGEIKTTNDDILAQMETSNKEFGEIVRIISEIGEKTNVINDIVFQTKLLSFNASVEAARAGEHGKGFAVVAEEVGNLAQMSGNAAKEITDMLSESIKRVNGIVEQTRTRVDHLIEVGRDKISMGQSTAQSSKQVLVKLSENATTIASMISEITHASKEQSQGIQEINKAISQLDQVTQQNSAVAQQSSSQAEELNAEADRLKLAVAELVKIVDGELERSQLSTKSKSTDAEKKPRKVVSLPQSKGNKTASIKKVKAVAGSDVVPSGDDSRFEEF